MKRDEIVISVKLAYVAVLAICAAGLLGYAIAADEHSSKDAMMEKFQSWEPQEQQDFILAAVSDKSSLRREIAEDWCAINKKTQRVCWNARMLHPIRGVK